MSVSVIESKQNEHTNRIKKLPPLLINQLAAGEVVTRPASVVKELIENAIDAGASDITIRIMQGGMDSIEVCDNGCGIHPDDMAMAVTRFATSKVADVAHLQGIATLGFRGEALAATAAVSRLTLRSSSDDSGIGRELAVAGILADTPSLIPVVHPQGTTVIVKDLYFNVPARRGNLKSIATEFAHIEAVVKQLALVASDVAISLWHNDKRRFDFAAINSGSNQSSSIFAPQHDDFMQMLIARLQTILPSMTGLTSAGLTSKSQLTQLQPLTVPLMGLIEDEARGGTSTVRTLNNSKPLDRLAATDCGVYGFLLPCVGASGSMLKLIYINGRLVKEKRIAQILREAVNLVEGVSDLGYVLFLQLPQTWLNVNVHPSKQCVKIQNLPNITAHLQVGVKSSLQAWYKRQGEQEKSPQSSSVITLSNNKSKAYEAEPFYQSQLLNNERFAETIDNESKQPSRQSDYTDFSDISNQKVNERAKVYDVQEVNNFGQGMSEFSGSTTTDTSDFTHALFCNDDDRLICLSRLASSDLNLDDLDVDGSLKPNISKNKTFILVQWQQMIYLFVEQTLMNGFILDCPETSITNNLADLTDYLRTKVNRMNSNERVAFANIALHKLSLAELTKLMFMQSLSNS